MGVCASCLGNNRSEQYEEDDDSRLLNDDINNMHYGSFGQQQLTGQEDPLETQREIEALQRVVARTSDNMVDIFEITPQDTRAAPKQYDVEGEEDPKMARYQSLLSKLSEDAAQQPLSLSSTASTKVDWVPWDEDNIEMHNGAIVPPLKIEAAEPFVGTFADAAAVAAAR
ncbi:hypothetical protein MCOR27_003259 [Pyricularia oryzae]|uniref:Late endosomal/lysosomal adaptor and MAPK and MTOR activator 1 n=2 Tax=Pyricularia TaxID=48558 RepID=A0ABQ8NSE0_PYRGI|nr:hypothetical protein MCOR01_011625 [Pyricularia oryzae]KAI6300499.1 hypothetical protein MCOR33_003773 [Pyricularia grisea]KAH9439972.1 hypothetical protein MCOR02_003505 [Pyricularia oryzae]KAI6260820.1 hypothetical protein MCOR19_002917 [Pyricularia oryzae]KAI6268305.1 hypothetical protein MCOR26_009265 [Pyricularia oryzae]